MHFVSLSLSYHDMAKPYFSPLNQQSIPFITIFFILIFVLLHAN